MAKETISKTTREPTVWANIFANDILDKGLISKYINNSHNSTPGIQTIQLKNEMGKGREQTLLQRRQTEGPGTYERMLSIASHQRDAN